MRGIALVSDFRRASTTLSDVYMQGHLPLSHGLFFVAFTHSDDMVLNLGCLLVLVQHPLCLHDIFVSFFLAQSSFPVHSLLSTVRNTRVCLSCGAHHI